jgi:hypothetical protein
MSFICALARPASVPLLHAAARGITLALGCFGGGLVAADGPAAPAIAGTTTTITSDGSTITTTITGSGSDPSLPPGVTIQSKSRTDATPSRWDLDTFAGVRFGGIIGASFDNTLTYDLRAAVMPEASADIGVGGVTFGLGARWTLSKKQWTLSNQGLSLGYDSTTAIILRAIAPYRWEDRHRHPSLWRGIVSDGGWYYGGEMDILIDSTALAAQATWEMHDRSRGLRYTLAYGFGF